jgi:hypothetical protein
MVAENKEDNSCVLNPDFCAKTDRLYLSQGFARSNRRTIGHRVIERVADHLVRAGHSVLCNLAKSQNPSSPWRNAREATSADREKRTIDTSSSNKAIREECWSSRYVINITP